MRDMFICIGWLSNARWVIVGHDDSGGIEHERFLGHDARVNLCAVYSALKQLFVFNHSMFIIQKKHGKYFAVFVG